MALNRQQKTFSNHYAATGDAVYSATKAGYASPAPRASQNLALATVQAEIVRLQTAKLFNEALPAAVKCLVDIIQSDKAPAGARVQAAKVVLDRTLGSDEGGRTKEPSEMTPEELANEIDKLTRIASERAKPVENHSQLDEPEPSSIDDAPSIFE
jgi:phage terminase small subunit